MSRPLRARALMPLLLAVAAGCQNYNFNPVGHCLVQPGTERVTLADVSTADVLFVVDDSGSMAWKQQQLASNFGVFIKNLNDTNLARAANGQLPIDFHVAVTTTSVFWNAQAGTCSSTCGSASGSLVCCSSTGTPVPQPKACSGAGDTSCPAGTACSTTCTRFKGENRCCAADGSVPQGATVPLQCAVAGAPCGDLEHHYNFAGCTAAGVAVDQYPFPRGDFVSWNGNPRVLHFDKTLYPAAKRCSTSTDCAATEACLSGVCRKSCTTAADCGAGFRCAGVPTACLPTNGQGFTSDDLVAFFVGGTVGGATVGGNVIVGTCGSGEEQALQGARLAVQKALANQQKDTYDAAGNAAWNATTRTASAAAAWPHDKAKLAIVVIGDEDDCSSPDDSAKGIVMTGASVPGADACVADATLPPAQQQRFQVGDIVDYFAGLGRPLGAAFVASAQQTVCGRSLQPTEQISAACGANPSAIQCTPGVCLQQDCPAGQCSSTGSPNFCGGQAAGFRLFATAESLKAKGADVVEGSVCDPDFGQILNQVAEIVKPPSGLVLPTMPADGQITLLRIAQANGQTRELCKGPAPASMTAAQAGAAGYDWWFTLTRDGSGGPVAVSQFVFINHATNRCEANPGETYSADYIAQQPVNGCTSKADCASALGGASADWGCYAAGTPQSTCICCSGGSTEPACLAAQ